MAQSLEEQALDGVPVANPSGPTPIDTDRIRDRYARSLWETVIADDGGPLLRLRPTIEADIAALCDEVDRRRAAIAAIARHVPYAVGDEISHCATCEDPDGWPCPTERAHRLVHGEELDRG